MSQITDQKPGPADVLRQMKEHGANVYRAAYEKGMSLSVYLQEAMPSTDPKDPDAFTLLMAEAGIRTRSKLGAGVYASTYDQFAKHLEARALLPEWWARQWRQAQTGQQVDTRGTTWDFSDYTPNSWSRSYADDPMAHWSQQIAPAIPLSELVGMTTPIDRPDYRAHYLTYSAAQVRMNRVQPGAEVPLAKLTSGDRTIIAQKFGRALEATYEQLQFQRLDEIAMTIQMMAIQAETDKVAAALYVIINGDGNASTGATNYNLTSDLDTSATAGTLTLKGWLSFKMKFANPYILTTALMTEATALQVALLNVGSANVPLAGFNAGGMVQNLTPINSTADSVRYGWTSEAPASTVVGFDKRLCLKQLNVIGADISEVERFTRNQTEVFTMTEMNGFCIMDANTAKTLTISA